MKTALWFLASALFVFSGCSTTIGTTIVSDRLPPPGAVIEPIGFVSGTVWVGRFLWAAPADKDLYEATRQKALDIKGGNVLTNAKVTTTMTSYFMLFYKTEITVEGTAAKFVPQTPAPE